MILLRVLNDCTITTLAARITPTAKLLFSLGFYLILERGKLIPRDILTALFWPNVSPRSARHSLRRALWQLRRYGFPLSGDHELQVILPKDAAALDLDSFLNASDDSLLTHPFNLLPWFPTQGSAEFRDWVDDIRYIIHTRVTLRLNSAATHAKARGDWGSVLRLAERTLDIDPDCTIARTNATQARQALRTPPLPRLPTRRAQLLMPSYTPLRPVTLLGESPPRYGSGNSTTRERETPRRIPSTRTILPTIEPTTETPPNLALLITLLNNAMQHRGTSLHILDDATNHAHQLVTTLSAIATSHNVLVIHFQCTSDHTDAPLSTLTSILPQLLNAPGAAGCDPSFTKYLTQLPTLPTAFSTTRTNDSIAALGDLVTAIADEQPILLLIEHIHLADAASRAVLSGLTERIARHAVLLLLTAQSDAARTPTIDGAQQLLHLCTHLERALIDTANGTRLSHTQTSAMLTTLRDARRSLHIQPPPHDELELLTLNTLRHTEQHWLPIANCAYECVVCPTASLDHRFDAGTLLCSLAAGLGSAHVIRDIQQTLLPQTRLPQSPLPQTRPPLTPAADGSPPTIPYLKFLSLSHALIGDRTIATQAADALLPRARRIAHPQDRLDTLLLSGHAFHHCGLTDAAFAVYSETFARATREQWRPHAMQAAHALTRLALDRGDLDQATNWCARTLSCASSTDSRWELDMLLLLQLRVALALNHSTRATHLSSASAALRSAPLPSTQAAARASHLRLLVLQGADEHEIKQKAEELLALSRQLSAFRIFHYEFFSLYLAFSAIGDQETGTQLLQDYLAQSATPADTQPAPTPSNGSPPDTNHHAPINTPANTQTNTPADAPTVALYHPPLRNSRARANDAPTPSC